MKTNQVKLKWSKKENDWIFNYPDLEGKSLTGIFFDLLKTTGHRVDYQRELKDILTERGYDFSTLKITCDKLKS